MSRQIAMQLLARALANAKPGDRFTSRNSGTARLTYYDAATKTWTVFYPQHIKAGVVNEFGRVRADGQEAAGDLIEPHPPGHAMLWLAVWTTAKGLDSCTQPTEEDAKKLVYSPGRDPFAIRFIGDIKEGEGLE